MAAAPDTAPARLPGIGPAAYRTTRPRPV